MNRFRFSRRTFSAGVACQQNARRRSDIAFHFRKLSLRSLLYNTILLLYPSGSYLRRDAINNIPSGNTHNKKRRQQRSILPANYLYCVESLWKKHLVVIFWLITLFAFSGIIIKFFTSRMYTVFHLNKINNTASNFETIFYVN